MTEFELNYNEFALRTYDPQIGRWTGNDPFDEFPSPYTGMGNDPVRNVDPTGGFLTGGVFAGLSTTGRALVGAIGGAIIGSAVDVAMGGDGLKGAVIGAGLGLGAMFMGGATLTTATTVASTIAVSGTLVIGPYVEFLNQYGNKMTVVPEMVQKMFNTEYGIKVKYENNQLIYDSDVDPGQPISADARERAAKILKDGFIVARMIFGWNLEGRDGKHINWGASYQFQKEVVIDLADFSPETLQPKYFMFPENFPLRAVNLARIFEHEAFGHIMEQIDYLSDELLSKVEDDVINPIRRQLGRELGGIERISYSTEKDGKIGILFGRDFDPKLQEDPNLPPLGGFKTKIFVPLDLEQLGSSKKNVKYVK